MLIYFDVLSVDDQLPVSGERKKDKRHDQSDTLGKLWFIGLLVFFKKSLHSLSTADKISKKSFSKQLYLEYRA